MKIKQKIASLFCLLLLSTVAVAGFTSQPVQADAAGDYCSKKYPNETGAYISNCERAFNRAAEGKTESCNYGTSPYQAVCKEAFQAGGGGGGSTSGKKACDDKGGQWVAAASGNGGSCNNTVESCKRVGKALIAGVCQDDAVKSCSDQFPVTSSPIGPPQPDRNKAAREACIAGATNDPAKPPADCTKLATQAEKDACEKGKESQKQVAAAVIRKGGDAGQCGKAKTNIIDCGSDEGVPAIANVLKIVLFIMTIIIGIVATGGIAYGAILYASAEDNSGQISKAKGIIRDVAIGLLLYGFMIAIINWLIPTAPVTQTGGNGAIGNAMNNNGNDPGGTNGNIVDAVTDIFNPFN